MIGGGNCWLFERRRPIKRILVFEMPVSILSSELSVGQVD